MPEGPSIVILRTAVEALHLEGEEIVGVSGNTTKVDKSLLLHQRVIAFRSWGKHFLICFETGTLRIHLMLFGSYRIKERKETPPRLSLKFSTTELNFYACSVKFIPEPATAIYDWTVDVMSDQWNADQALRNLQLNPDMLACDALLDQHIFAGSGNIIKNEVLYRIHVHPLSRVGSMPEEKLREMIKETRRYSFQFLEWKQEFTLRQHWLAHNRSVCLRCALPLTRAYLGKTHRRSFFCTNCQKLYQHENHVS